MWRRAIPGGTGWLPAGEMPSRPACSATRSGRGGMSSISSMKPGSSTCGSRSGSRRMTCNSAGSGWRFIWRRGAPWGRRWKGWGGSRRLWQCAGMLDAISGAPLVEYCRHPLLARNPMVSRRLHSPKLGIRNLSLKHVTYDLLLALSNRPSNVDGRRMARGRPVTLQCSCSDQRISCASSMLARRSEREGLWSRSSDCL